jgi:DNA repair protein RecO (recombination protein O)
MKAYRVHALVIRSRAFMEADRLVTLFSRERGKIQAVARGARRPRNRFSGSTGVFTFGIFHLFGGKNLENLSSVEVLEPFGDLREDLDKIAYASYFAELVDKSLEDGQVQEDMFTLLLQAFHVLDAGMDPRRTARAFEIRLLMLQGLQPELNRCVHCGVVLDRAGGRVNLSAAQGGVLCAECRQPEDQCIQVSRGSVEMLKRLAATELSKLSMLRCNVEMEHDLERMLRAFLSHYIDRPIPTRAFLETVQMTEGSGKKEDESRDRNGKN